ncbi:hypothetical protein MBENS4_3077 [Novosphingobium sp. MBES04]|nr:hypothetical protein MBENS4_3077 [Novosphingobium sp. MBES04]
MNFHGRLADIETIGDHLVGVAHHQTVQRIDLALGQEFAQLDLDLGLPLDQRTLVREMFEQRGGHDLLPLMDETQRPQ